MQLDVVFDDAGNIIRTGKTAGLVTLDTSCKDEDGWVGSMGNQNYTCSDMASFKACGGDANNTFANLTVITDGVLDASAACCECGGGIPGYDAYTWTKVYDQLQDIEVNVKNVPKGTASYYMNGDRGDEGVTCTGMPTSTECDFQTEDCSDECSPDINVMDDTWSWKETEVKRCCNEQNCCNKTAFWSPYGVRHSDSPAGHLVTNAMMNACKDCDAAFQNGGGIRGGIGVEGSNAANPYNVTLGNILNAYPYQNTISTATVHGSTLIAFLTHSVSGYNPADGSGKFHHMAGTRMAWNPVTSKIISVELCTDWSRSKAICVGDWKALAGLALQETYKIAVNNFIMGGGDDYDMLKKEATDVNEFGPRLDHAVGSFIENNAKDWDHSYFDTHKEKCAGFKQNFIDALSSGECRIVKAADSSPFKCPRSHLQECLDINAKKKKWSIENILAPNTTDGYDYTCAQCSGFGQCDELNGYTCVCKPTMLEGFEWPRQYVAEKGLCTEGGGAGLQLAYGDDCGTLKSLKSEASIAVGALVAGILLLIAVSSSFWINSNKRHTVIKASQPKFQHLVNAGSIICGLSCVVRALPAKLYLVQRWRYASSSWIHDDTVAPDFQDCHHSVDFQQQVPQASKR